MTSALPPPAPASWFTRRLTILLALLASTVVVIGGFAYGFLAEAERNERNDELAAVAELKARQLEDWLSARGHFTRERATGTFFVESVAAWLSGRRPDLGARLLQRLDHDRQTFGCSQGLLLDLRGEVLLTSGTDSSHRDDGLAATVASTLRQPDVQLVDLHTHEDGQIRLGFIMPVRDALAANQPAIAVLYFSIDPDTSLYPLLQSWPRQSASGEILLVRRDGDQVLFLNELRHLRDTALKLRIPLSRLDIPAVQGVLYGQRVIAGNDYRGTPVLSATRPITGTPWTLVAKMDQEEVHAGLRR
jgi:hypothetical protein